MSRFRFIHAADLHLDTPFSGIGRAAPHVSEALRDASLDSFDALTTLAIAREAEFLLIAGDIYDGPERGIRAQIRFRRGLERLATAGIGAVLVHGNHDPIDGWSAIADAWPPGVTLLGSTDVTAVPIERDGRRLATVHGMSYPRRDVTENLVRRFRRGTEPGVHIGLLHCNVGSNAEHAAYSPCSIEDLRATGMDYWALGHIHRRQVLCDGGPWIVYPGNTQGRSPKPSERGAKGALVVDVEDGAVRGVEFAAVDRVRFVESGIDVTGSGDISGIARSASAVVAGLQSEHAGRGLIVTGVLRGDPGGGGVRGQDASAALRGRLARPEVQEAILQELRHEWSGVRPFVWWQGIQDSTRTEINQDTVRGRGDFSAELLGLCDRLEADPGAIAELIDAQAEPLRRVLASPLARDADRHADPVALVAAARTLALNLLESEESQ